MTIKVGESEKLILKTIIDGGEGSSRILLRISKPMDFFSFTDSVVIFETAKELRKTSQILNLDTISANCQVSYDTINEIARAYPALPLENVGPTLESLKRYKLEKDIVSIVPTSLSNLLYDESKPVSDRIIDLLSRAEDLSNRLKSQDNVVEDPQSLIDQHKQTLEKRIEGLAFYPTGDRRIDDRLTYGLNPGGVTFIGGRPSNGKSHLALHLARCLSMIGKHSVMFNFEMNNMGTMDRALSMMTGAQMNDLTKGFKSLSEESREKIFIQLEQLRSTLKISMFDKKILSIPDLEACVEAEKERTGSEDLVVFIDLLTKMKEFGKVDSAYGIEKICNRLQVSAKALQVHLVPIVQINRTADSVTINGQVDLPKIYPSFNQIKNSGAFEEIADNILLVCRPSLYARAYIWGKDVPHCLRIEVGKQRGGLPAIGADALFYQLQAGNMTITDPPPDWKPYITEKITPSR